MRKNRSTADICRFFWLGLDRSGNKIRGTTWALSPDRVKDALGQQHIFAKKIIKIPFSSYKKRVKPTDITLFFRQLATLIQAGVPLVSALHTLYAGEKNPGMRVLLLSLKTKIESGHRITESLKQHSTYFDPLCTQLVHVGERSGTLHAMLQKIATYKEKSLALRKKVKKALSYPATIILLTSAVITGLCSFILPQFQALYSSFGAELPLLTRIILRLSMHKEKIACLTIAAMISCTFAFYYLKQHSKTFILYWDQFLLRSPILGSILQKAYIARFASTLSITFSAGLPLYDAIELLVEITGNQLYKNALQLTRQSIALGKPLHQALEETALFPTMVTQMILVGEESGEIGQMLHQIARSYEEALYYDVDTLTHLLEPVVMVIVGLIVGLLMLAMYLPIFKLGAIG